MPLDAMITECYEKIVLQDNIKKEINSSEMVLEEGRIVTNGLYWMIYVF